MTIETVSSIRAAQERLNSFLMVAGSDLPEWPRAQVNEAASHPSPVRRICGVGEAIYANRADVSDAALEVAAVLIQFATMQSWQGLDREGRGGRIVMAIRRALGESPPAGMEWPSPETDPLPLRAYVAPAGDN